MLNYHKISQIKWWENPSWGLENRQKHRAHQKPNYLHHQCSTIAVVSVYAPQRARGTFSIWGLTRIKTLKTNVKLLARSAQTHTHTLESSLADTRVGLLFLLQHRRADAQPAPETSQGSPSLRSPSQPFSRGRAAMAWTDQAGLTCSFWSRLSCRDEVASAGICKIGESLTVTTGGQQSLVFW